MTRTNRISNRWLALLTLAAALATCTYSNAAEQSPASAAKQQQLIQILQSDAPKGEKAVACKRLAVFGTKDAIAVLVPLLADEEMASWARIGLESNPDPAVDAAFRDMMNKLKGKLAIGVINSIGVRRDAGAVSLLVEKLKDADNDVASAAAEALGRVGGDVAAKALQKSLTDAPEALRPSIAEGAVLCAGTFLAQAKYAQAKTLYDAVREANVPKQRKIEAIRGAILSRQSAGIPLLLEQLRSHDKGFFGIGLRTARELPGRDVTAALVKEFNASTPEHQVPLLLAMADRKDPTVLPAVLKVGESGSKQARMTAISLLDRWRDLSSVPVLLAAASDPDPELVRVAKSAMVRFEGKALDADLTARLAKADGKVLKAIIEMVARRRIVEALPGVVKSAENADATVRMASYDTIGFIGQEQQAGDLVRLLRKTKDTKERDNIEKALVKVAGRAGVSALPSVTPLCQETDASLRRMALPVLAAIGGSDAIAGVKNALNDQEESIQDEAVNMLCTWPNTWPDDTEVAEPLLTLAKTGKKPSYQVQAMRGYLLYLQENKKLTNAERLAKVNDLIPLLKEPAEKRQAISLLGTMPAAGSLELLMAFAEDATVTEEACLSIVTITKDGPKDLCVKALKVVQEKSKNDATKKKADDRMKKFL